MEISKTKRPLSIWIALIIFYLFALLWTIGFGFFSLPILNFYLQSYSIPNAVQANYYLLLEILLRGLFLLLQFLNLWSLHQRKLYSRWISLAVALFIAGVMIFFLVTSFVEEDLRTVDSTELAGILFGMFLVTTFFISPFVWIALSFAFFPSVKKYFAAPLPANTEPPPPEHFFPTN